MPSRLVSISFVEKESCEEDTREAKMDNYSGLNKEENKDDGLQKMEEVGRTRENDLLTRRDANQVPDDLCLLSEGDSASDRIKKAIEFELLRQPQEQKIETIRTKGEVNSNENQIASSRLIITEARPAENRQEKKQDQKERPTLEHEFKFVDRETTKWWKRTRMHVALLGLAIAAFNSYAQSTFCIVIVEMVLPADYSQAASTVLDLEQQITTLGQQFSSNNATNLISTTQVLQHNNEQKFQVKDDESCPIEFKYRNYYDNWRFPASTQNSSSTTVTSPVAASSQTIDTSNRFNWDAGQQGLLLGAFAFGTAPLQVVGGRLAEIYGAKWVLLVSCLGTALTNLTIPYIAHSSFALLMLNRILMGVSQAGMEPGLMCLLAQWLTPTEAGFFISMLLFAICVGFFLGSLLSGFILALGFGWPLTYYVSGGLNLLVGLIWLWLVDSWPHASSQISPEELRFIQTEQGRPTKLEAKQDQQAWHSNSTSQTNSPTCSLTSLSTSTLSQGALDTRPTFDSDCLQLNCSHKLATIDVAKGDKNHQDLTNESPNICGSHKKPTGRAPWLNILTTRSVWAFIICKISIRWCADVLSNELPTYLANVLHLSIEINGLLNSVSSALFAICSFFTGWLVNEISTKKNWHNQQQDSEFDGLHKEQQTIRLASMSRSKTRLRKICQSTASFGSALSIFLMTRYDCNLLLSMSMLLVLSCCLVMGTGGELQIPYDMTSRYPGTLHGMACTMSVSGWLAPPLIGLVLSDKPSSRERWNIVWYLTAMINLAGGLVFVLFADASARDFDKNDNDHANEKNKKDLRENLDQKTINLTVSAAATVSATKTADAGYANAVCINKSSASSVSTTCNSSPRIKQNIVHTCKPPTYGPASALNFQLKGSAQDHEESLKHESQTKTNERADQQNEAFFDEKLIKVRQLEASFVVPGSYPTHSSFSPLASLDLMLYPFQEKQELPKANNKVERIDMQCNWSIAAESLNGHKGNNKDNNGLLASLWRGTKSRQKRRPRVEHQHKKMHRLPESTRIASDLTTTTTTNDSGLNQHQLADGCHRYRFESFQAAAGGNMEQHNNEAACKARVQENERTEAEEASMENASFERSELDWRNRATGTKTITHL